MKVKEILAVKGSKVCSTKSAAKISEAVRILVENKIGALLVYDDLDRIVGIITERDIMRACHEFGKTVLDTPVKKVMTQRVMIGSPEDDLEYIMNLMTKNRIRHVPIIENEALCGMISIGDVVKTQLHDMQVQIKYLKDYMHGGQDPAV